MLARTAQLVGRSFAQFVSAVGKGRLQAQPGGMQQSGGPGAD